jgi:chromate reductase, NAD(P)H dehydrogenase (quinone)
MTPSDTVAVLVGSLRRDSFNRKMANALIELAPADLPLRIVEIGDLPHYNEDLEASAPEAWTRFRGEVGAMRGAILVSPEYNRSFPGALKNALDVGSRPVGQSVWKGKRAAVITVSPGAIGGFGANHHLRQALVGVGMLAMAQPETYIGQARTLFDESGKLTNESTRTFVQGFVNSFAAFVKAPAV